jgi:hypothetical protein
MGMGAGSEEHERGGPERAKGEVKWSRSFWRVVVSRLWRVQLSPRRDRIMRNWVKQRGK